MIGRPVLLLASKSKTILNSLEKVLNLFLGKDLPHHLKIKHLNCNEDLKSELDGFSQQEIFNTVCVLDLTEESGLNTLLEDKSNLKPSELILRYPEVYWIFLTTRSPEIKFGSKATGRFYEAVMEGEESRLYRLYKGIRDSNRETITSISIEDEEKDFLFTYDAISRHHVVTIAKLDILLALLRRHANGFRTYFDPTGLRRVIGEFDYFKYEFKQVFGKDDIDHPRHLDKKSIPIEPMIQAGQPKKGVVLDEETNFSLLNGYILYRHGFEVYLVGSKYEADRVNNEYGNDSGKRKFDLVLEDVDIRFEDCNVSFKGCSCNGYETCAGFKIPDAQKFKLDRRKENFKFLDIDNIDKRRRIFVTFLKEEVLTAQLNEEGGQYINKPHEGIFALKLVGTGKNVPVTSFLKAEPRFSDQTSDHSAPYLNYKIAEALLTRARRYAAEAVGEFIGTPEAVQIALLALEAREILGDKTPFLSIEAFKMQQQMETIAECSFVGTAAVQVERRFNEIEWNVAKMDYKNLDQKQQLSALVEIADDLRHIYNSYEQFEEEEKALKKVREYRWRLKNINREYLQINANDKFNNHEEDDSAWKRIIKSLKKNKKSASLGFQFIDKCTRNFGRVGFSGTIERYFNWLMEDIWNIAYASIYWISIFYIFYFPYFIFNIVADKSFSFENTIRSLSNAIFNSASTFIALQPAVDNVGNYGPLFWIPTILEMVFGFSHLGIFIAYLYQKIARK